MLLISYNSEHTEIQGNGTCESLSRQKRDNKYKKIESKTPEVRVDLDVHDTILLFGGGMKIEVVAGFIRITSRRWELR